MILRVAAASELRTSAVNLSMLARTASIAGSSGSSASAGSGPNFGGMTTSHPALRSKSSAPAPTSLRVRAVIRTFQTIRASLTADRTDSTETAKPYRTLTHDHALRRRKAIKTAQCSRRNGILECHGVRKRCGIGLGDGLPLAARKRIAIFDRIAGVRVSVERNFHQGRTQERDSEDSKRRQDFPSPR